MKPARYYTLAVAFTIMSLTISGQTNATEVPKESKLYKEIVKTNNVELCNIYLAEYPQSKKVEMVKSVKERQEFITAYSIAAEKFSDTALRSYINNYPEGTYKQQAVDAIEVAAWQNAYSTNTIDSYQKYLNEYPQGKASKLAKDKLEQLK